MTHQNIDNFFKLAAILFGQLFVDAFGLDYHIIRLYRNELNTFKGNSLFADIVFETREGVLLNFEFQDVKITKKHLKRYMDYKVRLQCDSGKPVVTIIICTYHVKSKVFFFKETETSILKPITHYLVDYDDEVKYLSVKNKVITNLKLSYTDVRFLVFSPFMVKSKFRLAKVREVCSLIEKIKKNDLFDDEKLFMPLILAIEQYVSDEGEKRKLMDVITMDVPVDAVYEKVMSSGVLEKGIEIGREDGIEIGKEEGIEIGKEEGIEIGREKGMFDLALKIKHEYGIDEAVRFSGFSREELEKEELNRKDED